jgi:hypothetical protein
MQQSLDNPSSPLPSIPFVIQKFVEELEQFPISTAARHGMIAGFAGSTVSGLQGLLRCRTTHESVNILKRKPRMCCCVNFFSNVALF